MVLQGWQKTICEADQAIYSLIVGMSGQWLSVATMLNDKMEL